MDAASGRDLAVSISDEASDWAWFDDWDEAAAEKERLDAEKEMAEMGEDPGLYSYSEEEMTQLTDMKREAMLAFAEEHSGLPHGARAVELVNELGIGDGATATAGTVMMEGCHDEYASYKVEVLLDNGKTMEMDMIQESMELLGYERYDIPLVQAMYG